VRAAIAPLALPAWPYDGPIDLVEHDPASGREAVFTVVEWRLVEADGSAGAFDHEVFRILRPYVEGRKRKGNVRLVRDIHSSTPQSMLGATE
jgi:hypothetical protein